MRILYAAQSTPNEIDLPDSKLWDANLLQPLLDLGHEITRFTHPWLSPGYMHSVRMPEHAAAIAAHRPGFSEALLQKVREEHEKKPVDVLFTYFLASHVEAAAIREISALGIVTVNWFCNASYQFELVEDIAPAYDFCLVPEKFRLDDYRRIGARPLYCQEAANPNVYAPRQVPREFDVTFVGQCYGNRPGYIRSLLSQGIDARVWGPGWRVPPRPWLSRLLSRKPAPPVPPGRAGEPLTDDGLIEMYSRSRISLGFSTVDRPHQPEAAPIRQVRLRDFEAPMSGAFYCVEYFEELTEFFEPDREIICFRDEAELLDKVRHYLRNDAARESIRDAGLRRARAEHTWHQRFSQAFRAMGLN